MVGEIHKALAEWMDVYKANEVKALLEPDAVQTLLDEYESERRARQEAEAQAAALKSALNDLMPHIRIGPTNPLWDKITDSLSTDTGKQYLAIVEAARQDYEAAKRTCQTHKDEGRCQKPPYSKCYLVECPLDHFGHLEEVLSGEA